MIKVNNNRDKSNVNGDRSSAFIVNFEHVPHIFVTLNRCLLAGYPMDEDLFKIIKKDTRVKPKKLALAPLLI